MTTTPSFDTQLERYAELLLAVGVNLQPGQNLVISTTDCPVEEAAPMMRALTKKAYAMGARNVFPRWSDAQTAHAHMAMAPAEALSDVDTWRIRWMEEESARGTAFLTLDAPDPDLYADVNVERLSTVQRAWGQAAGKFREAAMKMAHPWSIGAIATRAWARKAHPELSEADGVAALWQYIFRTTRIDQPDPAQAWRDHLAALERNKAALNARRFRRLHYSAPGTDLHIDLPEGHLWEGGTSDSAHGVTFAPNMPTEEVFSAPARGGVNGTVRSTMPLNYNGTLIDGIRLTLVDGRITEYAADQGADALKSIIETDDGSHYLGEVALVTADSPVNIGKPVYDTLFDENASCHIAIGRAYAINIEGGVTMTPEELAAHGLNNSTMHVDFMIGSRELHIDGETASGERVPVFRNGMWADGFTTR